MSFNYNNHKLGHGGNDSFWTSYSDLFLGLSCIFLLLYVTASLRTGTDAIKAEITNQKLTMKVKDLENQLKMYDQIRKDYVENSASPSEAKEYRELMDKLALLKEEAKDEKERLTLAAMANEEKEQALNKYQQMIRNVINANKLAKTKLVTRETIMDEQRDEITTKDDQVTSLQQEMNEKQRLIQEGERQIQTARQELESKEAKLKAARKNNQISAKIYEQRLAKLHDASQEQIDQLRDANESYQKNLAATEGKLKGLSGELGRTQQGLANAQQGLANAQQGLSQAKGEAAGLRGELAKAKAEIDARRGIARQIKKEFAARGIKAEIDMENGDVVLDFGDHYFESGSTDLKPEMVRILKQAMPAYSRSLFGDPKLAKQISAVEVIGFASPTYRGRYVDPHSTKPDDKQALKYNMDLSYGRAKSIFNYVLDEEKISFEHQRDLLPLLKVSGRSFLEVFKEGRAIASGQDFCKAHDCKKAQRVIIRFNMERKK
jgi:outer membrane protein OmpA-like peptidoglycan-associated protein